MSPPLKIIVLTGGAGRTGKQVVQAALAQFSSRRAPEAQSRVGPTVEIVVEANVRSTEAARRIVRQATREGSVICHTLVEPEIREVVARELEAHMTPAVDILGPVINLLSDQLNTQPRNQPGLSYEVNKEQFDRMDAVDFSLEHDDGRRPEDYAKADVVLVGVSRVSKSVTCLFLAYRGIRAANVAITPGIRPPEELLQIDPGKVIALRMNAPRLQKLREARGELWKGAMQHYSDPRQLVAELREFNQLVAEHGWRCIDVSYKAVEDVASEITKMLGFNTRVTETN